MKQHIKSQAKKRIEKLREVINHHRYRYHVLDSPEISDAAHDSLKHELKQLEQQFPEFITPDSPTQRVSGKALDKFKKVTHVSPMLSLEDVFSIDEFAEWEKRIAKLLGQKRVLYFGELKFDGIAISLLYEQGTLVRGATRGDGKIGEDVTQNIRTIESIPLKLEFHGNKKYDKLLGGTVEVRGEVVMTKKAFKKLNKVQKKKGEKLYANARNLAAGSIRQLDPAIAASRELSFFAYALLTDLGQRLHGEEHDLLKDLGFKTDELARMAATKDDVADFYREVAHKRKSLAFDIDGLVISVNDSELYKKLGVVGKAPRGAVALKFAPEEATTIVENIIVQIGRTGAVTPVAVLRPVRISGVTVSRATLHNMDEIGRLGVNIGDTVIVGRAGDVIPDVREVVKELRTGKEKPFHMPTLCPVCGQSLKKGSGGVLIRCMNKECPARHREALYHFVSKKAFDIDGLGPKTINALLDEGLIQDAADLFSLKEGDLVPLERFGEKSASNLREAIDASRRIPLARFIMALVILHVGEETAIDLAHRFRTTEALKKASLDELTAVPNIGEIVAKSIHAFFRDEHSAALMRKLKHAGVTVVSEKGKTGTKLKGKIFVFTGELKTITRDEAKALVRSLGGTASESVSARTDYVVVGDSPGLKHEQAKKFGVSIMDEKEFLKMAK